jgi:hypothetical protein
VCKVFLYSVIYLCVLLLTLRIFLNVCDLYVSLAFLIFSLALVTKNTE